MNQPIRIAIAEDHELVRQGMIALFDEEEFIDVVFDVCNGAELIDELRINEVDIILLDLDMPVMSGLEALKIIQKDYPDIKVIIVSMYYSDDFISQGISIGARGFLPKNCKIERVIDAIFAVHDQGYYFDDKVSKALLYKLVSTEEVKPTFQMVALTDREREIVEMICEGKVNKEIAEDLNISIRTVETHRKNIAEKTNAKNIAGVVIYAIKRGIYTIKARLED